jgi:methionyl-tRNA formyltransferase
MRIVFMGTPAAAAISLQRLLDDGHEIAAVYTQPDRPSGRGNKITFSPVKELALSAAIPILQPTKIRTPEALEEFRSFAAEVAVVVAYGRILPEGFLQAFPNGAVNVHFSLLPKYRGAAPVNWAIVNGEKITGVTTMNMDVGLDTGDILLQRELAIEDDENSISLMSRLADLGADLLSTTIAQLSSIEPVEQDHLAATLAPIMSKEDGRFDWDFRAERIAKMIRGFQPFPTTFTSFGGKKLTLWSGRPVESSDQHPGTVIDISNSELIVSCGEQTAIAISEIQLEGKRRMSVRDFLNGVKLKVGDILT